MRELKFRLYFYEGKKLTYSTHTFEVTDKRLHIMLARFEENKIVGFVQYSGLKDKNGNLIFEGDIIRYIIDLPAAEPTEYTEDVTFVDGCFAVEIVTPLYVVSDLCEVVGNIYEHAHLLKQ